MTGRKMVLSLLLSTALLFGGTLSAYAAEPAEAPSADDGGGYYYAQLSDDAKLIYDALAAPENLELLETGEAVTVGTPYTITIPQNPTQAEYNDLVNGFSAASDRQREILGEMSNAAAAFDRERSDIFWTGGVHGHTELRKNGIVMDGTLSLSPGNTYTVSLKVGLFLVSDWDSNGVNDRDLQTDRETLQRNVEAVAESARAASHTRYGRLQKVNELLLQYNDYNSNAAEQGGSDGYGYHYPWTALAGLDQISRADDAEGGLKPVCEGYARALDLICRELEIPCVLVSGRGNDEEHMWAYVQMEDEIWYAMDVTWNDSLRRNDYFLVGSDVMSQSHEPRGLFMSSGQTTVFSYPTLAARSYDPNKLTLNPSAEALVGGGRLTLTVGGALEGEVRLVCDDARVSLTEREMGVWVAELPNETADYTFTATFEGDGIYHGITATCTVRTERHTHAFDDLEGYDDEQHIAKCDCGEENYEAHTFGDWLVTKEATATAEGSRERACICGTKLIERIAPTGGAASDSDGSQAQTPIGGTDGPTSITAQGSLFGCFSSATGGTVVLCTLFGALLTLRRRKKS